MNNIISDHARQDIVSFLPLIAGWEPAYGDVTLSFLACATVKNSCFSRAISFFDWKRTSAAPSGYHLLNVRMRIPIEGACSYLL